MTYFEPAGRWEGNRIGLGMGTFLRFRERVSSQCGALASVRAPCRLSPLSTESALLQARRLRARTNDPLDDADAESIEDPADNPEVTMQREQRLSTMNLCCKPTT